MYEYLATWNNEHGAIWGEYLEPWGQEHYIWRLKTYEERAKQNKRFKYFIALSFNGSLNNYHTNLKRLHMEPLKEGWGGCGEYTYGGEHIILKKKYFFEWLKSKGLEPKITSHKKRRNRNR